MIIGKSRDMGQCTAKKRDGQSCGSWCDRRVAAVCDYHLQQAVKSRRAARPEFAVRSVFIFLILTLLLTLL
jgi:minichromosome maintenance protein 10